MTGGNSGKKKFFGGGGGVWGKRGENIRIGVEMLSKKCGEG